MPDFFDCCGLVSMNVCYIDVFFRMNELCALLSWIRFYFLLETLSPRRTWKQWKPLGQTRGVPSYVLNFQIRLLGLGLSYGALDETSVQDYLKKYEFPDFPILRFNFLSNFQFSCHIKLWRCGLIFENVGVQDLILPTSQSTIPPLNHSI